MTREKIAEIIIEVVIILGAFYFLFFKSWLKALGREVAKLSTIEQLTRLTEGVKKNFNEEMEAYKSKLNEELNQKIEPLKAQLAKSNITHQIEYNFLHQERSKAILELYRKLIELHSAMIDWTRDFQAVIEDAEKENQERIKRVNIAMADFNNFYLFNKVFFSETFCEYIDAVFKEYRSKGWDFGYRQERIKSGQLTAQYMEDYSKDLNKIASDLQTNLPGKIKEIENMVRKMLNVVND